MAGSTLTPPGTSVQTVVTAARQRWTWVVGATLIGLALGLVTGGLLARSYSASSTVTINPITSTLFATGPLAQQVNTATEAEVMASGQVRALAAETLADGTTPQELGRALTVSIPTESLALTATTTASSGDESARRADAVTDAYLAYRRAQADAQVKIFLGKVDERIAQLEKALANRPGNAASISAELTSLRRDQSEALTLVVNPGSVIERATPPAGPSWPRLITLAAAGAAAGFLVGLGLVVWRVRREGVIDAVEEMTVADPGREPALAETVELPIPADDFAAGNWNHEVDDEILALRVAIARLDTGQAPIVVLGPPEASPLALGLDRALDRIPSAGTMPQAKVIDQTASSKGVASVAAAQAGVLVLVAVRGTTSRSELSRLASHALGVTQRSTPVVNILLDHTTT